MEQQTGSVPAPAVLEEECFASKLGVKLRSLRALFVDPPPSAFPRQVSLHRRRCPRCRGQLEGQAELRVANGVVQALCRGCGFGVDLFWVPGR